MRCWWTARGEWLDGPSAREGRVEGSGVLAGRWSVAPTGRAHARWPAGPGAGTALRARAEEARGLRAAGARGDGPSGRGGNEWAARAWVGPSAEKGKEEGWAGLLGWA